MRNLRLLYCAVVTAGCLLIASCGGEQSKPVTGQAEPQEINDQDFEKAFKESNAKALEQTPISYETATAQGEAGDLKNLVVLDPATACVGLPTRISDLIGGAELNIYKFDQSMSASASAMGFSGSIGKKEMVFIQDYVRYKVVKCGNVDKRIGIGLRCFIHVKSIKGKIGGSLSNIAASVELERAKATFNLKSLGFGIDGSVLAEGLSPQGDYNVENFGKLAITFHTVLKTLNSASTMAIQPVELP